MSERSERITVDGPRPYDVVIGSGVTGDVVPLVAGASRVAVLYPPVLTTVAQTVRDQLVRAGHQASLLDVPDGEQAKSVTVAADCWNRLGELGFTRTDAIVGVGGGATTDLAGWVAAAWLRGVRVVHVPTTLAGMVDAAVGGKTGVNTHHGKNLVGAFHPPAGVLCDLTLLRTLPVADYRAGLAEVVKCGFIADPHILDLVEADPDAAARAGNPAEPELVARTVRVKAEVVSRDLTETGPREILNYGHTLGHAIERLEDYRWRHGDAVSVGLVFAAALGRRLERLDPDTADRHAAILAALGLPTRYRADALARLLEIMRIDKKARGNRLRFIVLDGLAEPGVAEDPDPDVLAAAYEEVAG